MNQESTEITIMIAEDHHMFREGVINNISKEKEIKFIGEADNGLALLELLEQKTPDIVLMDIKMPEMDGVTTTRIIQDKYPDVKIIALTMYDNDDSIIGMLEAGASGYLLKNTNRSEMVEAIHDVFVGKRGYDKFINTKIVELISKRKYSLNKGQDLQELNAIEIQIITLLCKTYSAKEIADILKMSYRTVEGYKSRLLTKFEARNTTGIVIYALKNRLVRIEDI
jgi:DNA-binding NarL/FixJ family response regulator